MKNTLILLFCFFSLQAFAKTTELEVLSTEFGVEDNEQRKTLCLTVLRVPSSGSLIGLVEDITDCFYTRQARRSHGHLQVNLTLLKKIDHPELHGHLQKMDPQLEFYFSDGE